MTVYLVGAGPGDVGLVTRRAAELLGLADVVVHDRLVTRDVLALASPTARRVDVGKRDGDGDTQGSINDLLVELGRSHDTVVRLKGGDPFLFGRGGEEVLALRDAGVDVEVVPGVSSALAGPALAGVPVTHRGLAEGVAVVTATGRGGEPIDLRRWADPRVTLVVLMGAAQRARVATELIEAGLARSTPVAAIERASTLDQRVVRCDLGSLGATSVSAPAIIVIGAVAGLDLAAELGVAVGRVA